MKSWMKYIIALLAITHVVQAEDYSSLITEEYLRSEFVFGKEEQLKYTKCDQNNGCKYIWGKLTHQDRLNMKYGGLPLGKEINIHITEGVNQSDFEEGFNNPDVWEKENVGTVAVWSDKRTRLIVLSPSNKMISINILNIEDSKIKKHSIAVAKHLISQL